MTRPAKVRIRLENQSAYIEHLPVHLIDEILGCDRRVFDQADDGHITSHVKRVRPWEPGKGPMPLPEYTDDTDDAVRIPRGLIHRLRAGLEERGSAFSEASGPVIPSQSLGVRPHILDELSLEPTPRERLKQIVKRGTTWVEYAKAEDRIGLMAALAVYYSEANILIVTKNDNAAMKLARRLRWILDVPISVGAEAEWQDNDSRIHIRGSSSWFDAKDDDWQVVIVDGLSAATARQSHWSLLQMDRSLRFGFVQRRQLQAADQYTTLRAEALFGPCISLHANPVAKPPIVQMMAQESDNQVNNAGQRRESSHICTSITSPRTRTANDDQAADSCHVGIITPNPGHRLNDGSRAAAVNSFQKTTKKRKGRRNKLVPRDKVNSGTILQRKRRNEWNNEERNARIANVACAVRSKNKAKLTDLGCKALWRSLEALKTKLKPNVAIFVESAEHARELHKLLPQWTVLRHEWANTDDTVARDDGDNDYEHNVDDATRSSRRVIVTETYVTHRHVDVDVLIVASGSMEGLLRAKKNDAATANGISTRCVVNASEMTQVRV